MNITFGDKHFLKGSPRTDGVKTDTAGSALLLGYIFSHFLFNPLDFTAQSYANAAVAAVALILAVVLLARKIRKNREVDLVPAFFAAAMLLDIFFQAGAIASV